jgi:hypothetical protein
MLDLVQQAKNLSLYLLGQVLIVILFVVCPVNLQKVQAFHFYGKLVGCSLGQFQI